MLKKVCPICGRKLGYEMSDEERELKEGTNHLFVHTGRS